MTESSCCIIFNSRSEKRSKNIFTLYPPQTEAEMIERRTPAAEPSENMGHRILVVCNKLDLQLNIEPIFATLALYDVKSKRKVSENFHFDMNRCGHY